jgi:hypothetical protein
VDLTSADPCVAARHVTGRLLDLSHVCWRPCVADLSLDHPSVIHQRDPALRHPRGGIKLGGVSVAAAWDETRAA